MSRTRSKPSDYQNQLLSALRAGAPVDTALDYIGLDAQVFGLWLSRGERGRSVPFRTFARAITRALAEFELRNVALISKAAEKDWRAGAWLLEHRFPERWARGAQPEKSRVGALAAGLCMRKLGEIRGQKAVERPRQGKGVGRHQDRRQSQ